MTPDEILNALDPEQRDVARAVEGPVVVLAGAGTGKTRAITHRIAYAVGTGAHDAASTLAVTFTNRAAAEMRERLSHLGVRGVQARTFHSAALRQLRFFWAAGVGGDFPTLINAKARYVNEAATRLGIASSPATVRDLAGEIEWAKRFHQTKPRLQKICCWERCGHERRPRAEVLQEPLPLPHRQCPEDWVLA